MEHNKLLVIGIDEKGYGKVYKLVMRDKSLPLTAKALYAYFCSYAGGGSTAFPSRDKIISDLHLASNTYAKYLNCLLEKKYLKRHRTAAGNVYEIMTTVPDEDGNPVEVKSKGYGTVPKVAMLDDRLPVAAKAIYAYLCSYAGAGNTAYPKHTTILHELSIGRQKYYTYYALLIKLGYITPIQNIAEKGRFSSSTYLLNEVLGIDPRIDPEEVRKSASISQKRERLLKNQHTVDSAVSTELSTAISQKSAHGQTVTSQKSSHGATSQKSASGYLRTANINNNLHNKQIISPNGDMDEEITNIRACAREVNDSLSSHDLQKRKIQELIQYDRVWDGCQEMIPLKRILNPQLTNEMEAAYLADSKKVLDEIVRQSQCLLYGQSEFVKIDQTAYRRSDLCLKFEVAMRQKSDIIYEVVPQIVERMTDIRNLPAYIRKLLTNLIA